MHSKKILNYLTILLLFISLKSYCQITYSEPSTAGDGGYGNVFIGNLSGSNSNSSAGHNVGVGISSLKNNLNGSFNTAIGAFSLELNTSGNHNVAIGRSALNKNLTGSGNVAIHGLALLNNLSGTNNIAIGQWSLNDNTSGNGNIAIGVSAGKSVQGNNNFFSGEGSGHHLVNGNHNIFSGFYSGFGTEGGNNNIFIGHVAGYTPSANLHLSNNNTYVGYQSGYGMMTGNNNTFLGTVKLANSTSTSTQAGNDSSNTIVLADGASNQRLFIHSNGFIGIGLGNNQIPQNRLELNGGVTGTSGLRFRNYNSASTPVAPNGRVLTVNALGDVVLTTDQGSGGSTLIQAGTNVTVTGTGVVGNPYIINSTASGCNLYSCDGTLNTTPTGVNNPNPGLRTITMGNNNLFFNTSLSDFNSGTTGSGRIYIGNSTLFPVLSNNPTSISEYRLLVEGGILTEKVKVALRSTANWADYIFADDYKLTPLNELESFIKKNKHLPGIESVETLLNEGLDIGKMQARQMAKIEELTLYIIQQNKDIEGLKTQVKTLLERK